METDDIWIDISSPSGPSTHHHLKDIVWCLATKGYYITKDTVDQKPVPMLLWCPECGERHVDEGEFATKSHHTHACQHCGHVWRPAIVATCGVQFLPGFKNGETK